MALTCNESKTSSPSSSPNQTQFLHLFGTFSSPPSSPFISGEEHLPSSTSSFLFRRAPSFTTITLNPFINCSTWDRSLCITAPKFLQFQTLNHLCLTSHVILSESFSSDTPPGTSESYTVPVRNRLLELPVAAFSLQWMLRSSQQCWNF